MKKYKHNSSAKGVKFYCEAISHDSDGIPTRVSQIIETNNEEYASVVFNEFLENHFEDINNDWEVTIDRLLEKQES